MNLWKNDQSYGVYVLTAWNSGEIEEMHYASVETYIEPKYQSGAHITHFMPRPTPPQGISGKDTP